MLSTLLTKLAPIVAGLSRHQTTECSILALDYLCRKNRFKEPTMLHSDKAGSMDRARTASTRINDFSKTAWSEAVCQIDKARKTFCTDKFFNGIVRIAWHSNQIVTLSLECLRTYVYADIRIRPTHPTPAPFQLGHKMIPCFHVLPGPVDICPSDSSSVQSAPKTSRHLRISLPNCPHRRKACSPQR
jgi:hypothetical protein